MNAYELYDAAFDSANDSAVATAAYVQAYADGAFDIAVSAAVAQQIVDCKLAVDAANQANGEGQNNLWHLAQSPLSGIEL